MNTKNFNEDFTKKLIDLINSDDWIEKNLNSGDTVNILLNGFNGKELTGYEITIKKVPPKCDLL